MKKTRPITRLGLRLLSDGWPHAWQCDSSDFYLYRNSRGGWGGDLLLVVSLLPLHPVLLVHVEDILAGLALQLILLPPIFGVVTTILVGRELRAAFPGSSLDELMLANLEPYDIARGIAAPVIARMISGVFIHAFVPMILLFGLIVWALLLHFSFSMLLILFLLAAAAIMVFGLYFNINRAFICWAAANALEASFSSRKGHGRTLHALRSMGRHAVLPYVLWCVAGTVACCAPLLVALAYRAKRLEETIPDKLQIIANLLRHPRECVDD